MDIKKVGIFAAGLLFGTAGIKVLSSKDAKKVYTNCTAAALRAKKCVMNTATTIQENIYQGTKQINADREAEEDVVVEDIPAETAEETAECACEAAAENTEAVEA